MGLEDPPDDSWNFGVETMARESSNYMSCYVEKSRGT